MLFVMFPEEQSVFPITPTVYTYGRESIELCGSEKGNQSAYMSFTALTGDLSAIIKDFLKVFFSEDFLDFCPKVFWNLKSLFEGANSFSKRKK